MERYEQIIILTKANAFTNEALFLNSKAFLIDDAHLKINDDIYTFDYLIFTDPSLIINYLDTSILKEFNIPVVNFFYQTSIENIYYTSCDLISEAIKNIKDGE